MKTKTVKFVVTYKLTYDETKKPGAFRRAIRHARETLTRWLPESFLGDSVNGSSNVTPIGRVVRFKEPK